MAEFCPDCLQREMGLDPEEHPEWLVEYGFICEGCGYTYLNEYDDGEQNT